MELHALVKRSLLIKTNACALIELLLIIEIKLNKSTLISKRNTAIVNHVINIDFFIKI